MTKLKSILNNLWTYVAILLGGVVTLLLYYLNLKNEELEAYKAKIALLNTQKEADLLEVEIKARLAQRNLTEVELDTLQVSLTILEDKRVELTDNRTDEDKVNYWNNE